MTCNDQDSLICHLTAMKEMYSDIANPASSCFFPKQTDMRSVTGATSPAADGSIRAAVSKTRHATRHQRPMVKNEAEINRKGNRDEISVSGGEKSENRMF